MNIIEITKEIGNEIKETLVMGYEEGKEIVIYIIRHLSFSNFGKSKDEDFI